MYGDPTLGPTLMSKETKHFNNYCVVSYIANNYISGEIKMASVDGSRFLQGAADVMYGFVCGPCKANNVEREARHYCENCPEYLCGQCQDFHSTLTLTKNHRIVTGNQLPVEN